MNKNKNSNKKNFESLGLSREIVRALIHKGYKIPTPIQRKVIPLITKGKNVIATSRTGSGKTAAFLLPIIQKISIFKTHHKIQNVGNLGFSIKALIVLPTRELAIQTFKFTKEFSRYTNVKTSLILGGDSMENQFALFHAKESSQLPDILIATPGRLLHLFEEMKFGRLLNIKFLILDEADRLLELGFAPQIAGLVNTYLPKNLNPFSSSGMDGGSSNSSYQILLFSATFSSQMAQCYTNMGTVDAAVENDLLTGSTNAIVFPDYETSGPGAFVFAKCDTEFKISPQLRMEFIACKGNNQFLLSSGASHDKLNCLFYLLTKHTSEPSTLKKEKHQTDHPVNENFENAFPIRRNHKGAPKIPTSQVQQKLDADLVAKPPKKQEIQHRWKTLVFLPTKYHVEYIRELIFAKLGFECAYVYSSLDALARKINLAKFREGQSEILLVTDIAARGLDIPLLDCVINFTFPSTPKLFLHRVGRVARAGKIGVAYSLISQLELPHVLDFLNFIGHDLVYYRAGIKDLDQIERDRSHEGVTRPFHLFGSVPDHAITDMAITSNYSIIDCYSAIRNKANKNGSSKDTTNANTNDYDLTNMATVCDRALQKFNKSQSKPTSDSIRRVKQDYVELGGAAMLKPSPIFVVDKGICDLTNAALDDRLNFLQQLKAYKNKEFGQKVLNGSENKFIQKTFEEVGKSKTKSARPIGQKLNNPAFFNVNPSSTSLRSKFADSRLFVPCAPENYKEEAMIETPLDHIVDLNPDEGNPAQNRFAKTAGGTKLKQRSVWDPKRKRFVNEGDLKGRKKSRVFINESGVRVRSNTGKADIYDKWLHKTHGGVMFNTADPKIDHTADSNSNSGFKSSDNHENSSPSNDFDDRKDINSVKISLVARDKKDWRFRPVTKSGKKMRHPQPKLLRQPGAQKPKNLSKTSNKSLQFGRSEKGLGLKKPEQAFKVRYKKEQKQAFQAYRRNLNASKRTKKGKKGGAGRNSSKRKIRK